MTFRKLTLASILFLFLFAACSKDNEESIPEPNPDPTAPDAYTQRVNSFIYQMMTHNYLWNTQLPEIDWKSETDPKAYFNKLLMPEDEYSRITDDLEGMFNSLEGVEKGYGYSLTFSWVDAAETQLAAFVDYVYPNTPASKADIKRGDLISSINGQKITKDNFNDLYDKESITIQLSKFVLDSNKFGTPEKLSLVATETENNPVHTTKVLDVNGKKVGYLFYASYIGNFNSSLEKVFTEFKTAGVTEMILDLRYNLGGDDAASLYLSSILAPVSAASNKSLFTQNEYNAIRTQEDKEQNYDPNDYLVDTLLNLNLDLKRIFILTSGSTYSASEATILGLKPYMQVINIGKTTGGKYTGMELLPPIILVDGKFYLDPIIYNWGLLPVTFQFKNKQGESSKGGITPTYPVESFYLPMVELGDPKDPLIAKAVELIGGQPSIDARSAARRDFGYKPFAYKSSSFDEIKKNLIKIKK